MMIFVLENKNVEVAEPTFGKIKKVVSLFNQLKNIQFDSGEISDDALTQMTSMLALVLGKTNDEVDSMNISVVEIIQAVPSIAELCGLSMKPAGAQLSGEEVGVDSTASIVTS